MILGKKNRLKYSLKIGSTTVKESDEVELLGITIDKALNFNKHIKNLCRTVQCFMNQTEPNYQVMVSLPNNFITQNAKYSS